MEDNFYNGLEISLGTGGRGREIVEDGNPVPGSIPAVDPLLQTLQSLSSKKMGVKELKELLKAVESALAEEHIVTAMLLEAVLGYKSKEIQEHEQRCALESKAEEASDNHEGDTKKADAKAKSINTHGEVEENIEG